MVIEIDINDKQLEEKIYSYLESKKQQVNDAIIETLSKLVSKENNRLEYEIEDIEKNSTTIDFGIEDDSDIKLFENVDDVVKFSRELRDNAWK